MLAEVRAARPDADILYVADDAGFPYGAWEEAALTDRVVDVIGGLIDRHGPDVVVIACNTASTLVLPPLRARHALPFVGTVPAVKPAAAATRTGLVSVLATPGTVKRDYTRALIDTFAGSAAVTLVGSARLAPLAEAAMRGEHVSDTDVAAEIAPCFVRDGARATDVVVLACTHYPFLLDRFERLCPWPVTWIDPAPAIARRVVHFTGPAAEAAAARLGRFALTSGRMPPAPLAALFARHGLAG